MTGREREILRLENEMARLQEKIRKIKEMKDNSLRSGDINFFKPAYDLRSRVGDDRFKILGSYFKTTDDLAKATPKDILELKGWGKVSLERLEKWMEANGIRFSE